MARVTALVANTRIIGLLGCSAKVPVDLDGFALYALPTGSVGIYMSVVRHLVIEDTTRILHLLAFAGIRKHLCTLSSILCTVIVIAFVLCDRYLRIDTRQGSRGDQRFAPSDHLVDVLELSTVIWPGTQQRTDRG